MKHELAVAVLVLSVTAASSALAADTPTPVAAWQFNSSLADSAGKVADRLTARNDKGAETTARFVADELLGTVDGAIALGVKLLRTVPALAGEGYRRTAATRQRPTAG